MVWIAAVRTHGLHAQIVPLDLNDFSPGKYSSGGTDFWIIHIDGIPDSVDVPGVIAKVNHTIFFGGVERVHWDDLGMGKIIRPPRMTGKEFSEWVDKMNGGKRHGAIRLAAGLLGVSESTVHRLIDSEYVDGPVASLALMLERIEFSQIWHKQTPATLEQIRQVLLAKLAEIDEILGDASGNDAI